MLLLTRSYRMQSMIVMSNWLLPISFNQFKTLVAEFQKLATTVFGTECVIKIRALRDKNRISPAERMHGLGVYPRAVFFESSELSDVTAQMFDQAEHIEVSVTPMNILAGIKFAFGRAEFKGDQQPHRQATFVLQPKGDPNDFKSLIQTQPRMRVSSPVYRPPRIHIW